MTRTLHITVPSAKADEIVAAVRGMRGLLGLQMQRGVSLQPRGDVVSLLVTNDALTPVMEILDRLGVSTGASQTVSIEEPKAVIAADARKTLAEGHSEVSWEEMEAELAKESNMTANALLVMFTAGVLAGMGVGTGALHLVIAAMLIAPGFEPFTRIALGLVARSEAAWRGLRAALKGYAAVFIGAGLSTLLMTVLDIVPFAGTDAYLSSNTLVGYWTTVSAASLVVSAIAAMAGTLLVISNRAVLTGGVMIALALIPSLGIAGMALAAGRWDLLTQGLCRWGIEVVVVTGVSILTLFWKRTSLHRRNMQL